MIQNNVNNKVYIGSSNHVEKRLTEHFRLLKKSIHENIKLQRAFVKYGEGAFTGQLALICSQENKYLYEQIFIDFYDAVRKGYNINEKAERGFSLPLEPLSDNFFLSRAKYDEHGCLLFTGAAGGNGMAKVKRSGKFVSMQRLAYEFYIGKIPKGHFVYRLCKNRLCVNHKHLATGVTSDIAKHNFATGYKHPRGNVLLTEEQVMKIKTSEKSSVALAKEFNVSDSTIRKVRKGLTWQHVHANVRHTAEAPELEAYRVFPQNPVRGWA